MEISTAFFYNLGGYCLKLIHVFGAVIWLGGVLFMGGIAKPILDYYAKPDHADPAVARVVGWLERRLIGMNWMALWAGAISGLFMSFLSPQFHWFQLDSLYSWVLHLKVFLFLPIALTNFFLSASYKELETVRSKRVTGEDLSPRQITEWRIISLRRINVYLAFLIIILVALL
jgi:uncharacterized membrane protein